MEKQIFKISELKEIGYPEDVLYQLCHSKYAYLFCLPRKNERCNFYIDKARLDKNWNRIMKSIY